VLRPRHYILDDENQPVPCTLIEWALWWENFNNRVVDFTQITSECFVSTVFLGLDHRCSFDNCPPLLFETMIFGGPEAEYQRRYSTWDNAVIGHKAAVRLVRKALGQRIASEAKQC
jgi:hypothetical protein